MTYEDFMIVSSSADSVVKWPPQPLSAMKLSELRAVAADMKLTGVRSLKKNDLVAAISARVAQAARNSEDHRADIRSSETHPDRDVAMAAASAAEPPCASAAPQGAHGAANGHEAATDVGDDQSGREHNGATNATTVAAQRQRLSASTHGAEPEVPDDQGETTNVGAHADQQAPTESNPDTNNADDRRERRGRRRARDRNRGREQQASPVDNDELQPIAGIVDILDNYAFVRTSGYLPGPDDIYISMKQVRDHGLRRGDAITGKARVPRDGDGDTNSNHRRQKFSPLAGVDTINGYNVKEAKRRKEFSKLTPLYPNERLRLETTADRLVTRVIDLIMPIGKGQRALIQSPPKAGKTTILQQIANAITTNNPECHLMVVLADERPEEVTDMQRSVKGEVIASTFDRPPSDHTQAAELAIERAKRLVEDDKDVVVLLDSITRLGRAYNNSSPASGRILSGGVDSTALYPPKRFLGAARNIENGGSLTIIATALVETGSQGDTVIFEEFKGTGNAELKLDRRIAERRVFPAVDVHPSSTRKDHLLMSADEASIVQKLRRVLSGLDSNQAIDLLMSQLKKTRSNAEFLMQVQKTAPGPDRD
ncbi:transcription termination factor Rho [Mycobacterium sp. MUNTM1]